MKIATSIASALLGLAFIAFASMYLFNLVPQPPPPPEGTPMAHFLGAFGPTGYMKLIKALELVAGVLMLFPLTRRAGLLILGPIMINILVFHQIVAGDGIFNPILLVLTGLLLWVTWAERAAFARFLRG